MAEVEARVGILAGVPHDIEIISVYAHIGPTLLSLIASTLEDLRHG